MFRNVVLALFLLAGSAAANRVPTVDFTLGHSKLGSNPSPEVRQAPVTPPPHTHAPQIVDGDACWLLCDSTFVQAKAATAHASFEKQ